MSKDFRSMNEVELLSEIAKLRPQYFIPEPGDPPVILGLPVQVPKDPRVLLAPTKDGWQAWAPDFAQFVEEESPIKALCSLGELIGSYLQTILTHQGGFGGHAAEVEKLVRELGGDDWFSEWFPRYCINLGLSFRECADHDNFKLARQLFEAYQVLKS